MKKKKYKRKRNIIILDKKYLYYIEVKYNINKLWKQHETI